MRPHALTLLLPLPALLPASLSVAAPPRAPDHGVQRAYQDTTCKPCADFYRFANGAWLSSFVIPPTYSSYGAFDEVYDKNQEKVHGLLEDAVRDLGKAQPGSDEWKLGTFYQTCMDSARAEAEGAKPLGPLLARIAALNSIKEVAPAVAGLHSQGVVAMFRLIARQDFRNSDATIAFVIQGGLGLHDRDYYLRTDSTSRALLEAYRSHVARMLALTGLGEPVARTAADHIVALETALATASLTNVQVRDPKLTWHPMGQSDLAALAPDFDWNAYFAALKLGPLEKLNVGEPFFIRALDSLLVAVPLDDWKLYLRWHATKRAAPWLSSDFVSEDFAFNSQLSGEKELRPRWKRCIEATDEALGEALGRGFVERYFTPSTRERVLSMIRDLEGALHQRLRTLDWMNDSTRAQAVAKLEAFGHKIGYPDRWRDYSALTVTQGSFLDNVIAASQFDDQRQLKKIGKPLDRTEWNMTPPTVNAYYNASMNEIVFPAGILQPPFFDPLADDASNYGAMGAVIGHEMTHGFDDRGRQFDAQGNLRDWWTPGDADRFKARAAKVINQFNGYTAVDTFHVNGRLTTGENIADLGGLAVAYAAYHHSLAGKPQPPRVGGYSGDQRFFLSYAQFWRELVRPEQARSYAATDPHSPGRWRVNGPLSNLPEFAKAFGCRAGDAMVRPDSLKVRIW